MAVSKCNVSDAIKNAMKDSGMMQKDLAEKLGVNQSSISSGINRPRIGADVLLTMMEAMGYTVMIGKQEGAVFIPQWQLEKDK